MLLPRMNQLPTAREMIDVFKGYNHNLRIKDGEFYDMKNITSADYPVLSPRPNRGVYASPTAANGMIDKDGLCYVDGQYFVIGNDRIDMGLTDSPKSLVSMGAYVIIMPDKKYINTVPENGEYDHGDIEASVTIPEGTQLNFTLCLDKYGTELVPGDLAIYPVNNPADGDLCFKYNTPDEGVVMKYNSTTGEWYEIETYIMIMPVGGDVSFSNFSVGDYITISDKTDGSFGYVIPNKGILTFAEDSRIIFPGAIEVNWELTLRANTFIKREIPKMDFVIESGNRLWGCRYGEDKDGKTVNEIYASKLGDFRNWYVYQGISTDSYAASVGSDGPFTGAITHLDYPIFFKENCMHKVYGSFPSEFRIQTTPCRGVQKGCAKSLAIVNETLYYKSRSAVCAYDGSLPAEKSSALGDIAYHDACAGSIGNKYYISMADERGEYHLFVYDVKRGLWHKEDNSHITEFCASRGELYFICEGKIKTVYGSGTADGAFDWMVETGVIGTDSPDKKYISRLDLRMSLKIGTRVYIYIEYDSSGDWEHIYTMMGSRLGSFAVPIRPRRCDHLRLRIVGEGEAKIYSIAKTIEKGSDL